MLCYRSLVLGHRIDLLGVCNWRHSTPPTNIHVVALLVLWIFIELIRASYISIKITNTVGASWAQLEGCGTGSRWKSLSWNLIRRFNQRKSEIHVTLILPWLTNPTVDSESESALGSSLVQWLVTRFQVHVHADVLALSRSTAYSLKSLI